MSQLSINYDPKKQRLSFTVDGKNRGGFAGNQADKKFNELLDSGAEIKLTSMDQRKSKVRRLRAIWHKQGIDHMRADILEQYGVSSTADLNEQQLDELIKAYTQEKDSPREIRKHRSTVIMLLQDLGIYKNDGNWERVNSFLQDKRIAGKLLYHMNIKELKSLQIKLRAMKSKQSESKPLYSLN